MDTMQRLGFNQITKLPISEVVKPDSIGVTLIVETPHKGEVLIDYKTPETVGFIFTHTENRETRGEEIIKKLYTLEAEAKEFLLDKWLSSQNIKE